MLKVLLYGLYAYTPGIGNTDDATLMCIILKMVAVQGALLVPPSPFFQSRMQGDFYKITFASIFASAPHAIGLF